MLSNDIALAVRGLSKIYNVAHNAERHTTIREALLHRLKTPLQSRQTEEFCALQDVSFEVKRGEVVGIIGRNGAGKSTLLKILSQITEPTKGEIDLYGRVGSLLEVGTGFHQELTGRENIFLNGAILGMKRREIERQFDAIVDFAEVEGFLDTPVKRYSSGMHMRLAFSVAAHLNPEILIIDEVLAVGDAAFQKKCLGKMDDVAKQGRTVLFVSHQLSAVKSLCSRVMQIHRGRIVQDGDPQTVVNTYLTSGTSELTAERIWSRPEERPGNALLSLTALRVLDSNGELSNTCHSSETIIIEVEFDLASLHSSLCVGIDLINRDGIIVFRTNQNDRGEQHWPELKIGHNKLRCFIPPGLLNFGTYAVAPKIGLHAIAWVVNGDAEVRFDVQLDHSDSPFWHSQDPYKFPGVLAPCLDWSKVDDGANADSNSSSSLPYQPAAQESLS